MLVEKTITVKGQLTINLIVTLLRPPTIKASKTSALTVNLDPSYCDTFVTTPNTSEKHPKLLMKTISALTVNLEEDASYCKTFVTAHNKSIQNFCSHRRS